jgi:hypothetical protein
LRVGIPRAGNIDAEGNWRSGRDPQTIRGRRKDFAAHAIAPDPVDLSRGASNRRGHREAIAPGGDQRIQHDVVLRLWSGSRERDGARRYAFFYLLGGVVAFRAQVLVTPSSTVPMIGASGAIASVMGAFLMMYPRDRIKSVVRG